MVRSDKSIDEIEDALLEQYYNDKVPLDVVADVLGEEVALNVFLLKRSVDTQISFPDTAETKLDDDANFYR